MPILGQSCLATKISAPGPSNFGWFRHTDEPLGALVQGLEVVGELGVGILAEIKKILRAMVIPLKLAVIN